MRLLEQVGISMETWFILRTYNFAQIIYSIVNSLSKNA